MATITLKGNEIHTKGDLPNIGSTAADATLTSTDLSDKQISSFKGKNIVLNIFPSVDTGTCAMSVRQFNQQVASLENTVVLCVSKDLPFAQARFCAAEGIENVEMLSQFRDQSFTNQYELEMVDGPLKGLMSRCVIVINPEGKVIYTEQVAEIADEPNYEGVKNAIQ